MSVKLDKMIRYIPGIYQPATNPNVRGILYAWSSEDDLLIQAVQDAKEQLFVKYAQLQYLDALGSNVGVFRPTEFNLADSAYRKLIPALSFSPKQVIPTIKKVLDVFFPDDDRVEVYEVKANEIVCKIPSSVPSLRRNLKGSHHFHAYNGQIVGIDNVLKEITVDLLDTTKTLKTDELELGLFGSGLDNNVILSNTAGNTGVTLQFSADADLSNYALGATFNCSIAKYPGSFLPDPGREFTVTLQRGVLNQVISPGSIVTNLLMQDASGIPDSAGSVIFGFGRNNQEGPVQYFGRPNNNTLLLSPAYTFTKRHEPGESVNVVVKPYEKPAINGSDYSIYLVGVTAARLLAQKIVESIVAAGIVVRWIVVEPKC